MRRRLAAMLRDRRGASAIEFAFVLPPFLLLLLGIAEFGRLIWTQSALNFAVEEAVRCAAINTSQCGSPSDVQRYAVARAAGLNLPASAFTLSTESCGTQLAANYAYKFAVAGLFPYSITLTARSCLPA